MYQIGQLRRQPGFDYYTKIDGALSQQSTTAISGGTISFQNPCYNLNTNINNQNCYYLRFNITRFPGSDQIIRLKLRKNEDVTQEDNEQLIDIIKIEKGAPRTGEQSTIAEKVYLEYILAPNGIYNQILWQLERTALDYQTEEDVTHFGRKTIVEVEEFAQLVDVMSSLNVTGKPNSKIKYLSKIGIQGPPSLLTCINREQIRLGKNGIYELNNDKIKIASISFVPRSQTDYFILDYEYVNEED